MVENRRETVPASSLTVANCTHLKSVCRHDSDEVTHGAPLDASHITQIASARRDLYEAMKQVAETGHGPEQQIPAMGYSIEWKH
jgi:hypothetical protein